MKYKSLIKIADALIFSLILVSSLFSWISPSGEVKSLDGLYQLQWVIFPWIIAAYGKYSDRENIRIGLALGGFALLLVAIVHMINSSGTVMNIGEITARDIIAWETPALFCTIGSVILSLVLTIILKVLQKNEL